MEKKVIPAAFSFTSFKFTKFSFNLGNAPEESTLNVDFTPSGVYQKNESRYVLSLDFIAFDEAGPKDKPVIEATIVAEFDLKNVGEIPSFFYKNSIAIVYPYIRAFVSNLTLQANYNPLILPTLNLSMLEDTLIKQTSIVE